MRAIEYACREGAATLWRGRGASLFAIAAIALATTVLGALLLVTSNIERLLAEWSEGAEFSVFLRDDATSEQRGMVERLVDDSGVAAGREYVSKGEAISRFRRDFAELASLTNSLEDNPFPASVEVHVRPEAERDGRVEALVRRLAMAEGVADVRYDREWISRATAGLASVRQVGFGLALAMMMAAALTVATVVRLALHARRDEVEIMQLVGSPYAFIWGPFVTEGLLQGGLGALLALGALWVGFMVALAWWGTALTALIDLQMLQFLPAGLCGWLVAGGMVVGSMAGYAAARTAS